LATAPINQMAKVSPRVVQPDGCGQARRGWKGGTHPAGRGSGDPLVKIETPGPPPAFAVEAKDAPRGVDLVIITIPERNVPTLPKGLFAGVPASVVVVDTGNYYPRQRDGQIVEIESGMPETCYC
jgi:hypothetical protein